MTNLTQTIGVVLAGGQSRRMNGVEKSFIKLNQKTLLEHVVTKLQTQLPTVTISANGNPDRFSKFKLPIITDTVEGYAGPLAGVLAAMHWAQLNMPTVTKIVTAAADTPFFPNTYIDKIQQEHTGETQITFAQSNNRHHPVFGVWNVDLANDLEKFLVDEGNRKVMLFAKRYTLSGHNFDNELGIDPFFNINTVEDLEDAETHLKNLTKKPDTKFDTKYE